MIMRKGESEKKNQYNKKVIFHNRKHWDSIRNFHSRIQRKTHIPSATIFGKRNSCAVRIFSSTFSQNDTSDWPVHRTTVSGRVQYTLHRWWFCQLERNRGLHRPHGKRHTLWIGHRKERFLGKSIWKSKNFCRPTGKTMDFSLKVNGV